MTEPGKHRDRAAHRAERRGPSRALLWAALALVAVLAVVTAVVLVRGNDDGHDDAGPDSSGRTAPAAAGGSASGTGSASPDASSPDGGEPVVVSRERTRATTWTSVLQDPAVELGRPGDDEGTRGLIARTLGEEKAGGAARTRGNDAFKLRARTEGDAGPVRGAHDRLQDLSEHPTATSRATPTSPALVAGAAKGGPSPLATVVSRAEWHQFHEEHPDTPLVASTPGGDKTSQERVVSGEPLEKALAQWQHLAQPFHALTAIDISGSMAAPVGPNGATRMDLTKAAAAQAVSLFPDHDALGVWKFGYHLDGKKDHQEITPVREMSADVGGISQRERLTRDAKSLPESPSGYTGLYDTTLAAYRAVLHDDAPDSLKTVIVLTDGFNEDPESMELSTLLNALKAEQDPKNPVRIITVGISQEADEGVLKQIAEATGGTSHIARAPEDIQKVFVDALTGE